MQAVEIIRKKRDGGENSEEEIRFLILESLAGRVAEYQLSAWLMAVYFQGLSSRETLALTRVLVDSGEVVDFGDQGIPRVDKHSTGGVGDKTSLVVAPLVAAAGVQVPMISGRALGHTGGTLDKLQSIPGFRTELSLQEFRHTVLRCGCCLIGQTPELAPADRLLYSLRDVTATVESIPLIVASILSKKLAEGIDALVLDVKTGRGAFMKSEKDSRRLAVELVQTGQRLGLQTIAVISDMSQPLGFAIGNALEVRECLEVLRGRGPRDLRELVIELSGRMLVAAGCFQEVETARHRARRLLETGAALEKFLQVVEAQGGNPRIAEQPDLLPAAPARCVYEAEESGYLAEVAADRLGWASMVLGAGRPHKDAPIDPSVGLVLRHKLGDRVEKGQVLVEIHYREEDRLESALERLRSTFSFQPDPPPVPPLIREVIV